MSGRSADKEVRAPWTGSATRHIYLMHVRVRFHELDPLGHVNNAVYLNYLEQAAIDHAAAEGFAAATLRAQQGGVFIARRHEITYLQPAFEHDQLRIITWPEGMRGARAVRLYQIVRVGSEEGPPLLEDGLYDPATTDLWRDVVVSARTEWAFVDPTTGRPRRIPSEVRDAFFIDGGDESGGTSVRPDAIAGGASRPA